MPEPIPLELEKIAKSGLVSTDYLQKTIQRLASNNQPASLESVLKQLQHEGILSKWQAKQLRAGRFKGYFLQHYIVLKLSRPERNTYYAEVLDSNTGKYVLLKVTRAVTLQIEEMCMLSCDSRDGLRIVSEDARLHRP
jgi:hypothetical protein